MTRTVRDVMTFEVLTAQETDSVKEVARWLAAGSVSALPVVDRDRRVIGVVSEADLLRRTGTEKRGIMGVLGTWGSGREKRSGRVAAEVMTSPAITVRPEASVRQAARIMVERGVKRLPVVDEERRLLGIVSRADLVRLFVRPDEDIRREVREDVIHRGQWIDPAAVHVQVKDGIVVLQGHVEPRLIPIIVRLVEGLDGVVAVENRLGCAREDPKPRPHTMVGGASQ
jgi:CBS-domain-containing membrane protein